MLGRLRQYEKGLESILHTFLSNLHTGTEQPGVWISGFFGSGKSHLAKMLRALWIDQAFADGTTARSLVNLPNSVRDLFVELTTIGKRYGGLHAAAGTLGAGGNDSVRLGLLGIIFKSAGLPEQYNQARFILWLREKGVFASVEQALRSKGSSLDTELPHLFVSEMLAEAMLRALPGLADTPNGILQLLSVQFAEVADVSNDDMTRAIKDALSKDGQFPLTLVVLDEVQQFISDSAERTYKIQEITETCCNHFSGRLLFVATGQSALSGTPSLSRLLGRFQVPIQLSDTDVESVIRKVILAKKTSALPEVQNLIAANRGEISRHLRGSKLAYHADDETVMPADYPILPTRRRFWERALRTIDVTGTTTQLRNQLRVALEAVAATADEPLGTVVAGDYLYDQLAVYLLQTSQIPREFYEHIQRLSGGAELNPLKARLLKLVFLIGKLPIDAAADSGVRATADTLADLLVVRLDQPSGELRRQVQTALDQLVEGDGLLLAMQTPTGRVYQLQTQESSAWLEEYKRQEANLRNNPTRIDYERSDRLKQRCQAVLKDVRLSQGQAKEPRSLTALFDRELPKDHATQLYVWVQDGWVTTESNLLADARNVGATDPTVFVFIPDRNKSDLGNAITRYKAAQATLDLRGTPTTPEGVDARAAMQTRLTEAERMLKTLLDDIFSGARVWQAGGIEVTDGETLSERLHQAGQRALTRLYPKFDDADHPLWGKKVLERARKGDGQALEVLGHKSEVIQHPVCAAVLQFIAAGKRGADILNYFRAAPYGWPQDAIDSVLFLLLSTGHVRAQDTAGQPVTVNSLDRQKLTQTLFKPEAVTVTPVQKIQVRKLFLAAGISCQPDEELAKAPQLLQTLRERALAAGGDAPRPERPAARHVQELALLSSNALLLALFEQRETLTAQLTAWAETAAKIKAREPAWSLLSELLAHASDLEPYERLHAEINALRTQRSLLAEPDPVQALLEQVTALLRNALNFQFESYQQALTEHLAELQADNYWPQLTAQQQAAVLKQNGLEPLAAVDVKDAAALLNALDDYPLSQWTDRRHALPVRFDKARQQMMDLLEPTVVRVVLPKRTIKDESDLTNWLHDAETLLRQNLANGPIMV